MKRRQVQRQRQRQKRVSSSGRRSAPVHRSPALFERQSFESEDPWTALYIPAPEQGDSFPVSVRLATAERRKLEMVIASQRTPWATMSDAVRWLVYAGLEKMASVLGDAPLTSHLNMLKVENAMRAVEAKRVYLSRLTSECSTQMKHLIGQGEVKEAQRIFERSVALLDAAPKSDAMTRRLITEMLASAELETVRKAAAWKAPKVSA